MSATTMWYLELDIKIITFTSTPKKPFMTISGGDDSSDFRRPKLYVGYIPVRDNEHYQSLLPKDENKNLSTLKRGINQVDNDNGRMPVLRLKRDERKEAMENVQSKSKPVSSSGPIGRKIKHILPSGSEVSK